MIILMRKERILVKKIVKGKIDLRINFRILGEVGISNVVNMIWGMYLD